MCVTLNVSNHLEKLYLYIYLYPSQQTTCWWCNDRIIARHNIALYLPKCVMMLGGIDKGGRRDLFRAVGYWLRIDPRQRWWQHTKNIPGDHEENEIFSDDRVIRNKRDLYRQKESASSIGRPRVHTGRFVSNASPRWKQQLFMVGRCCVRDCIHPFIARGYMLILMTRRI